MQQALADALEPMLEPSTDADLVCAAQALYVSTLSVPVALPQPTANTIGRVADKGSEA